MAESGPKPAVLSYYVCRTAEVTVSHTVSFLIDSVVVLSSNIPVTNLFFLLEVDFQKLFHVCFKIALQVSSQSTTHQQIRFNLRHSFISAFICFREYVFVYKPSNNNTVITPESLWSGSVLVRVRKGDRVILREKECL